MSLSLSLHSEIAVTDELFKLSDAGGSVIQIRTRETVRTALTLRKAILTETESSMYYEWDVVNGNRVFTMENYVNNIPKGDDAQFFDALMRPLSWLRDPKSALYVDDQKVHYFVFLDAHPYMAGNPIVTALVQQYAAMLPSVNVCLIFVTPDLTLSDLPIGTVLVTEMSTPSAEELAISLSRSLETAVSSDSWTADHEIDEDDIDRIALLGLGMTRFEFETHAALAMVEADIAGHPCLTAEAIMAGIAKGKTEVVKQSGILELYPSESMEDVGGMQRLKDWLSNRAGTFSQEARDFGVAPPKGIAIVGVPGAGKSLIAKAVGGGWGIPVIRLDFGKVFSKFVGESEANMRAALNMISRMGRLVLFADEIDKGLGGSTGGGDSGISSRVLGTFLTWMQENDSDVFVVMTANKIEGLPPELFRKGRLDEVWSVGLPNHEERLQVLEVHLRKRQRSLSDFTTEEQKQFVTKSADYLPAEIEAAVKDALITAYNEDSKVKKLTMDHIISALDNSIPMSKTHKAQIDAILAWAKDNAVPVNYDVTKVSDSSSQGPRRIAARRGPVPTLN